MTDQETEILSTLDESQRTVVLAQDGHHLVLAPPGCGKTHILASRVRWAHSHGVGFEDMLLKTYDAYREDTEGRLRRYRWIQVDEVQDLNAMQLAIIDLLTAKERATVLFLGDEQQAIFSFMGAKVERLNEIKLRCKGHIHHLRQNHRAPSYLLGVLNRYAEAQLGIDPELLPLAGNDEQAQPGDLQIIYGATMEDEIRLICEKVRELQAQGTTAVVVSSNADANRVSQSLTDQGLTHFKVSGRDLFDTPDVRLLFAHLSVLSNEHNFIPWARILHGVGVFETHSLARRFSRKLLQLALTPDDLLRYDGTTTYLQEFLKAYDGGEIVVFDTETTGTDVYHDDIIEVSAMRVCQGRVVGEPLDLYIETDRPIPTLLGEKENPMYALYHQKMAAGELLQAEEALARFLVFVGDRPVVGHNVRFDYQILRYNLLRHGGLRLPIPMGRVFDTLKLMRLLDRNLRSYKLESLIDQLGLQGANTHQAIDDVGATVSLVNYCAASGRSRVKAQTDFLAHPRVRPFASKLRAYYGDLYLDAMARCYDLEADADQPALVKELRRAYAYFVEEHKVDEIPQLDDICRYIMMDLLPRQEVANSLDAQLQRYIVDLSTLKESDFCNSRSIRERIYVTTVHKAKGLEYDNVIIFDAVDGRYPNAYNRDKKQDMEDARKFYVALSRARRRLFVAYSMNTTDRHGVVHPRQLTPFMDEIMAYFG